MSVSSTLYSKAPTIEVLTRRYSADDLMEEWVSTVTGSDLSVARVYLAFSWGWCFYYGMENQTGPLLDSVAHIRVSFEAPESSNDETDILRAVADFGGFWDILSPSRRS
ncbi:uncharacterized protein B0I36DRAFT_364418 [Microdochium trichocladiopsis]|uniref:Uncharacterized protein n=1 Tax=Microdochium trichocladiopsis TaxID=1682393 RepID=A0A9P9BRC9_9PEZI|nr:uncharacterized protein B0I36DRAFT_364418 [Microdochium trichocladiopsis]KAH7027175.1 hypothetical protein B0I36DRAFT_364418 [Microdochium trichocladiopsis]